MASVKKIMIHDWRRMYRSGHTYMGRELWVYVDYIKLRDRVKNDNLTSKSRR